MIDPNEKIRDPNYDKQRKKSPFSFGAFIRAPDSLAPAPYTPNTTESRFYQGEVSGGLPGKEIGPSSMESMARAGAELFRGVGAIGQFMHAGELRKEKEEQLKTQQGIDKWLLENPTATPGEKQEYINLAIDNTPSYLGPDKRWQEGMFDRYKETWILENSWEPFFKKKLQDFNYAWVNRDTKNKEGKHILNPLNPDNLPVHSEQWKLAFDKEFEAFPGVSFAPSYKQEVFDYENNKNTQVFNNGINTLFTSIETMLTLPEQYNFVAGDSISKGFDSSSPIMKNLREHIQGENFRGNPEEFRESLKTSFKNFFELEPESQKILESDSSLTTRLNTIIGKKAKEFSYLWKTHNAVQAVQDESAHQGALSKAPQAIETFYLALQSNRNVASGTQKETIAQAITTSLDTQNFFNSNLPWFQGVKDFDTLSVQKKVEIIADWHKAQLHKKRDLILGKEVFTEGGYSLAETVFPTIQGASEEKQKAYVDAFVNSLAFNNSGIREIVKAEFSNRKTTLVAQQGVALNLSQSLLAASTLASKEEDLLRVEKTKRDLLNAFSVLFSDIGGLTVDTLQGITFKELKLIDPTKLDVFIQTPGNREMLSTLFLETQTTETNLNELLERIRNKDVSSSSGGLDTSAPSLSGPSGALAEQVLFPTVIREQWLTALTEAGSMIDPSAGKQDGTFDVNSLDFETIAGKATVATHYPIGPYALDFNLREYRSLQTAVEREGRREYLTWGGRRTFMGMFANTTVLMKSQNTGDQEAVLKSLHEYTQSILKDPSYITDLWKSGDAGKHHVLHIYGLFEGFNSYYTQNGQNSNIDADPRVPLIRGVGSLVMGPANNPFARDTELPSDRKDFGRVMSLREMDTITKTSNLAQQIFSQELIFMAPQADGSMSPRNLSPEKDFKGVLLSVSGDDGGTAANLVAPSKTPIKFFTEVTNFRDYEPWVRGPEGWGINASTEEKEVYTNKISYIYGMLQGHVDSLPNIDTEVVSENEVLFPFMGGSTAWGDVPISNKFAQALSLAVTGKTIQDLEGSSSDSRDIQDMYRAIQIVRAIIGTNNEEKKVLLSQAFESLLQGKYYTLNASKRMSNGEFPKTFTVTPQVEIPTGIKGLNQDPPSDSNLGSQSFNIDRAVTSEHGVHVVPFPTGFTRFSQPGGRAGRLIEASLYIDANPKNSMIWANVLGLKGFDSTQKGSVFDLLASQLSKSSDSRITKHTLTKLMMGDYDISANRDNNGDLIYTLTMDIPREAGSYSIVPPSRGAEEDTEPSTPEVSRSTSIPIKLVVPVELIDINSFGLPNNKRDTRDAFLKRRRESGFKILYPHFGSVEYAKRQTK